MLHIRKINLREHNGYIVWTVFRSGLHEDVEEYSLSFKDLKFFSSLKNVQRKNEYLATRILLHSLNPTYEIKYDKNGRPSLAGSEKHISISHSKDVVAIIVSDNSEAAIDVQYFDNKVLGLRKKFLSAKETRLIAKEDVTNNCLAWSVKESLFKSIRQENVPFNTCLNIISINTNFVESKVIHPNVSKNVRVNYKVFDNFVMTYIH